ncbi:MAG: LysR family transcriptional regulator [Acidobacteria bacterium]|nr:LysR family transcriptional regulator [Acidobacteriota bacterium]MBV9477150.1 LysR family transcriptional regulator [Acidobacteriota bacterium]
MKPISLNALDLNLLLAFEALYEERHVTRAAARVGLGQSSLSGALARLRAVFDDELFTRGRNGMTPTARARELSVPVGQALAMLRSAIETSPRFDAATSARVFHIATSDYGEAVLLPPLIRRLRATAPGIALDVTRTEFLFQPPLARLDAGDVDLALGFFDDVSRAHTGVLARRVGSEELVCVVRERHPRAKHRLTLRALLELDHIRVNYPGDHGAGMIDTLLRSRGMKRRVPLTVSHFLSIAPIVAATDLVGFLPARLARLAARSHRLRVFKPPLPLRPLAVSMVWDERREHDPAHGWLRALAAGLLTE